MVYHRSNTPESIEAKSARQLRKVEDVTTTNSKKIESRSLPQFGTEKKCYSYDCFPAPSQCGGTV